MEQFFGGSGTPARKKETKVNFHLKFGFLCVHESFSIKTDTHFPFKDFNYFYVKDRRFRCGKGNADP